MLKLWGDGRGGWRDGQGWRQVRGCGAGHLGLAKVGGWRTRDAQRDSRGRRRTWNAQCDSRNPWLRGARWRSVRSPKPAGAQCDSWCLWTHGVRGRRARFVPSMAARRLQTSGAIRVDRGRMAPRAPSAIRGSSNMPCGGSCLNGILLPN